MPFLLQLGYLCLLLSQLRFVIKHALFPSLPQSAILCLLVLAFLNKVLFIFAQFIDRNRLSLSITHGLASQHKFSVGSKFFVHLRSQRTRA